MYHLQHLQNSSLYILEARYNRPAQSHVPAQLLYRATPAHECCKNWKCTQFQAKRLPKPKENGVILLLQSKSTISHCLYFLIYITHTSLLCASTYFYGKRPYKL